jgi:serine protease AprX
MVLSLSPDEVRRLAMLDVVRFIYPSRETIATAESPSRVSVVLAPKPRPRFDPTGKRIGWNVERIGAPRVWRELGITGEGVTVAVLDVGVNYVHRDLRGNIWVNGDEIPGNGVDDDRNGYVDDVYGYDFARMRAEVRDTSPNLQHGTMTSGIVGGDGSGGIVTGVAPGVRLMPMLGSGVSSAALAYQYALENGADIVSMSFSIPNLGNARGLWRMMSDHAVAAGLVLVGGAGNFRMTAAIPVQHQSPKDVPSVIAVAGVDSAMQLVPFSSGGPAEWASVALYGDYPMPRGLVKPDMVAFPGPGYPVLAAADSGYIDPNTRVRGNSFSGPHGAGVAALVLSAAPGIPAWTVKEILEQTARDLGSAGKDNDFGAGLIDAFAAVKAAQSLPAYRAK